MRVKKYFLGANCSYYRVERRKLCKTTHTIGLDKRCHIDCGLIHLEQRVEMYQMARVDTITNQADKPKIWEVMMS